MPLSPDEKELAGALWVVLIFLTAFGTCTGITLWLIIEFLF